MAQDDKVPGRVHHELHGSRDPDDHDLGVRIGSHLDVGGRGREEGAHGREPGRPQSETARQP